MRTVILLTLALAACSNLKKDAEDAVAHDLIDPASAQFRDVREVDRVSSCAARVRFVHPQLRSRSFARRGRDAREARETEPVHSRVRTCGTISLADKAGVGCLARPHGSSERVPG